jgi:SAM-dependent methyltransferase
MESSRLEGSSEYSDVALCVLIEDLAEQGKVLSISNSPETAKRLAAVAQEVHLLCPGQMPAPSLVDRVEVRALKSGRLPWGDAYFDVVIVPELFDMGEQVAQSLSELTRVLRDDGVLVAGVANLDTPAGSAVRSGEPAPKGMQYQALVQALKKHFKTMRVVGQLPFWGYSMVDLAASQARQAPTEISFDGTLLEDRELTPRRYVAICSNDALAIDAVTVVQVPEPAEGGANLHETQLSGQSRQESDLIQKEVQRLEEALNERSTEVRSLRAELERRGALVRDLIEQTRMRELAIAQEQKARTAEPQEASSEVRTAGDLPSADAEIAKLRAERDAAIGRALDAEVARVEAQLHIDELSGFVATSSIKPPVAEEAPEKASEESTDEVRALRSLVAEMDEAKTETETRLASSQEQLVIAQERYRDLESQLREANERTDAFRSLESVTEELKSTRREVGELKGAESTLRMRLFEAESSLARELRNAEEMEKKKAEREAQLERLAKELSERQHGVVVLERSVASLSVELERLQQKLDLSKAVEARALAAEQRAQHLQGALGETLESLSSLADAVSGVGKKPAEPQTRTEVVIEDQDQKQDPNPS